MKLVFITNLLLSLFIGVIAQESQEIIPLSPGAAAIAKYGEIPVSHFTGVPNISLPIYHIKLKDLNLPLSLNYHAGGNKVETVASWVGLGWSINTIPSISRTVRGIPDEKPGGYFDLVGGKTVKELWEEYESGNTTSYNTFLEELSTGEADSEPDIFYYSLPEESGKFFYSQEKEDFVTYPKSNIKIISEDNFFRVISPAGIEYIFNVLETTRKISDPLNDKITTTWYASKIVSPNKTDEINFSYHENIEETYKSFSQFIKYQFINGSPNGEGLQETPPSIMYTNLFETKLVNKIDFGKGYIEFNLKQTEREDLKGGYNLDNISIYTDSGSLVKNFDFTFKYLEGYGCIDDDENRTKKWLILEKMEEVSPDGQTRLPNSFHYNESNIPSCRISAGQDYWGYYNGKDGNENLIPAITFSGQNGPIQISGADRHVDTIYSKFAILEKIEYPTGGSKEFVFENNVASAEDLPANYVSDYVILSVEELGDQPSLPTDTIFESDFFTINNPPHPELNDKNEDGGAFLTFDIAAPGCDLSEGSGLCATFLFTGTTINNENVYHDITQDTYFYVPNGTYKISAEFSQEDPQYGDFIFYVSWKKIEDVSNHDEYRFVGGLRIKEIKSFTGSNTDPIVKKFKYTTSLSSTISSGNVFGEPDFKYSDIIEYHSFENDPNIHATHIDRKFYLRIKSYSNIQQVSHSGSFIGYSSVFEETEGGNESGYIHYKFSNLRDIVNSYFPYAPSQSKELERGNLLSKSIYKKDGVNFQLTKKVSYGYTSSAYNGSYYPSVSYGLKWGFNLLTNDPSQGSVYSYPQGVTLYQIDGGWINVKSDTTLLSDGGGIETITSYYYDNSSHLYLTRTESTNSNGKINLTKIKYTTDINSGIYSAMVDSNMLNYPIEQISKVDGNIVGSKLTTYKIDDNNYVPDKIYSVKTTSPIEVFAEFDGNEMDDSYGDIPEVEFIDYDSNGRLLKSHSKDGLYSYYLWAYNKQYPVAKIVSSSTTLDISAIQAQVGNIIFTNSDDQADILTDVGNLKTALGDEYTDTKNQVTLYTYAPLIGMTSQTDPSGRTTYYEYDDFGRLEYVRDHNGHIVNKYDYHYAGQE